MVLVIPSQGPGHHHITGRGHLIRAGSHSLAITALGQVTEDLQVREEVLRLEAMDHQEEDLLGLDVDHIEVMDHQDIIRQDIFLLLDITPHQDMVHHDTTPHQDMVPRDTGLLVVTMAEVVTDIVVVLLDRDPRDSEDEEDHIPGVAQLGGTLAALPRDRDLDPLLE